MTDLNKKLKNRIIPSDSNILAALKKMDEIDKKLLFVYENNKFLNLLSIGDLQRALIANMDIHTPIKEILRKKTQLANTEESFSSIKEKMLKNRIECMPIINKENELIEVYFWEDIFGESKSRVEKKINLPVVIMAGGKGTRLKPLTNVIPKPLIPIGERTIIEEIINRFVGIGCDNFFLSINYKAETIKHYFYELNPKEYKVNFFQEEKPLGTAGSLFLIKDKIKSTFFVSNCDILIDEDYSEILKYHQENKNELTIISALKHYPIPYGIIKTKEHGVLSGLKEKPELTFQINSGMYILEPHLLEKIPENEFFHITQLIEDIQKRKGKIGVFPVSQGSWTDIGEWDEFIKNIGR